jgi:hypothetical protein
MRVKTYWHHAHVATQAMISSLWVQRELRLSAIEAVRFRKKVLNLSMCYIAFERDATWRQAKLCVHCGLACAIYDVLSDWREMSIVNCGRMEQILRKMFDSTLVSIATKLYQKEMDGCVANDGLERGVDSLEFILGVLKSKDRVRKVFDLQLLGMALQVVDDVLDIEDDLLSGDLNCLLADGKDDYLRLMFDQLSGRRLQFLSDHAPVFHAAVRKALQKAESIISGEYRIVQMHKLNRATLSESSETGLSPSTSKDTVKAMDRNTPAWR